VKSLILFVFILHPKKYNIEKKTKQLHVFIWYYENYVLSMEHGLHSDYPLAIKCGWLEHRRMEV
jgi:hypothetical protein